MALHPLFVAYMKGFYLFTPSPAYVRVPSPWTDGFALGSTAYDYAPCLIPCKSAQCVQLCTDAKLLEMLERVAPPRPSRVFTV
jgi:hypothetical protein